MVRVLCKGGNLDFAENYDWDEQPNISDFDLVFLNLRDLEKQHHKYLDQNQGVRAEERRQKILQTPELFEAISKLQKEELEKEEVIEELEKENPVVKFN